MNTDPSLARHFWPIASLHTSVQELECRGMLIVSGEDDLDAFVFGQKHIVAVGVLRLLHRDGFPDGVFEAYVPATISRETGLDALTSLLGCTRDDLDWVQEYAEWPGAVPTAESIERELAHR